MLRTCRYLKRKKEMRNKAIIIVITNTKEMKRKLLS